MRSDNILKIALCTLFLVTFSVVNAQEKSQEITLETCRQLILENNEDAIIASSKVKISEAQIKEARTRFFPSLSASATGSAFTDNPVLTTFAKYSVLSDVTLEQPIYFGGKIQSVNNLARIQRDIAVHQKTLSDEELLYYVEQLYWQVIAIDQQVVVARDYLKTLTELENKISDFYTAGIVNKTDLLETQVEKNRAEYNVEVAENASGVAKLQLSLAIGLDKQSFTIANNFSEKFIDYNYLGDVETAYSNRAEMNILEDSILAKTEEENLIKSDYRPQVGLNLGGYYYAGEETNPLALETDQGFGAAFLNVNIPIFKWGEKKHKLKRNTLEKEQIALEQEKTKNQISIEVQQAIDKIDEASIQVELSQKSKLQAEENARILNDNFTQGIVTSEEVLEAEALNQQAQLDYINARVAQQLSHSNYLKTKGELSKNNSWKR